MSHDIHKHCVSIELHSGEPKGKLEEDISLGEGLGATYVATPSVQVRKDKAVFYITDLFGITIVNHKLLADAIAEESGLTVYVPDLLGKPEPSGKGAVPVGEQADLFKYLKEKWFAQNPLPTTSQRCQDFIKVLKEKRGFTSVAVVGFCWGGRFAAELASHPEFIDGAVIVHPGFLADHNGNLNKDIVEAINKPTLWIYVIGDYVFPEGARKAAHEILEKNKVPNTFIDFESKDGSGKNRIEHGFAIRGSESDPIVVQARKEAKDHVVKFFRQLYHI
eukprot:TRINITY_DN3661_c0_g2_i2.p1 TRINITY_DN3661_c0_g2~~TRINITY_DN3661_c0_g2_i2.p1  ORF type:complete len:320 (-),score=73.94 TRINITY_DN3661_c0_g2_i2:188-1018(-)